MRRPNIRESGLMPPSKRFTLDMLFLITSFFLMLCHPATAQIPGLESLSNNLENLDKAKGQNKLPDIHLLPSQPPDQTEQEVEAIRSLFHRQAWQFDKETF